MFRRIKNALNQKLMCYIVKKVSRVEVIDIKGRAYTNNKVTNVELSLQDDDRTLKIFINING